MLLVLVPRSYLLAGLSFLYMNVTGEKKYLVCVVERKKPYLKLTDEQKLEQLAEETEKELRGEVD